MRAPDDACNPSVRHRKDGIALKEHSSVEERPALERESTPTAVFLASRVLRPDAPFNQIVRCGATRADDPDVTAGSRRYGRPRESRVQSFAQRDSPVATHLVLAELGLRS